MSLNRFPLINLLPHFDELFFSPLTRAEVLRRIQLVTTSDFTWQSWFEPTPKQPYHGEVNGEAGSFELRRITTFNNLSLPAVKGEVEMPGGVAALGQLESGSTVRLTMRLHPIVICYLLLLGVASIASLTAHRGPEACALFLMLGLVLVPFWLEVRRVKSFFKNLLQFGEGQSKT